MKKNEKVVKRERQLEEERREKEVLKDRNRKNECQ